MKQEPKFPELPPDQFWRVIDSYDYWDLTEAVAVELVQRKKSWLGFRQLVTVGYKSTGKQLSKVTSNDLVKASNEILKQFHSTRKGKEFLGDYPPKQLPKE